MREYVKIYCCGDCIYYNWEKHKCNRGANVEGAAQDLFYRDCPLGLHTEDGPDRFIDHYKDENVTTKYDAGIVHKYGNDFMIAYEQRGAADTFSIGQPVYDKDGNLMGYMGIGLFTNLNYSTEGQIRIPVEYWSICLPTKHCIEGKKVFTYWQTKIEPKEDNE